MRKSAAVALDNNDPPRRVLLHGTDAYGTSVSLDRIHLADLLRAAGLELTSALPRASVIHNVWWNRLSAWRGILPRLRPTIATVTNDLDVSSRDFAQLAPHVKLWVAPSRTMQVRLSEAGVQVFYLPFYVDERVFDIHESCRADICDRLGLPFEELSTKLVIGSFQRDSRGADLRQPKLQKGPDVFVNVVKALKRRRDVLVLLAGPRRHYLRARLKNAGIPYIFVGTEVPDDDITLNTLSESVIAQLYRLIDIYVMTSRSEGGPKSVLEASWARCPYLGTNVGLVRDFINPEMVCDNVDECVAKLDEYLDSPHANRYGDYVISQHARVRSLCSRQVYVQSLRRLYMQFGAHAAQ
jgi:glycosyltransferase involved in cell wall biosynthesis